MGLKQDKAVGSPACAQGLKRMGFPFGIETSKTYPFRTSLNSLKRMGFPFGIETAG